MAEILTGKLFADKYRVDSLLRSSGLGDFYRCRHAFTERPVILQIMHADLAVDPRTVERFSEMAKTAASIADPNILAVTDFAKTADGLPYAALENVEGETLAQALERDGRVPPAIALDVAGKTASGMAAAHGTGLIHGNLNTGNILVGYGEDGLKTVKLFDFGSANPMAAERTADTLTARDFAYVAPELCSGAESADERSDIYSLGVVFYEMLAGDVPFTGSTPAEIINKHIEDAPPPLSSFRGDLPAEIEPIVLKALSKNPEMRYQSAGEFADAIALYAAGMGDVVAGRPAVSNGNNIWKTAFVVLAGISLLSVFLIYGTSVKQTNPTTVLQPDANGQPVQPINPATGVEEQNLVLMPGEVTDTNSNSAMSQPPGTLPGGDGYNPWATGVAPPPGGPPAGGPPAYIPPGGQVYTIDPNNPSQFMPADGGIVLVPVPANTNTAKPTPKTPANANTQPAAPPANTAVKPTPAPTVKPASPVRPAVNSVTKPTKTPEE